MEKFFISAKLSLIYLQVLLIWITVIVKLSFYESDKMV